MKFCAALFVTTLCSFILIALPMRGAPVVGGADWKAGMRSMLTDVLALFPYAFDRVKIADPKNMTTIRTALDSLVKHAAELKAHTARSKAGEGVKADPSFAFIAEVFENELLLAQATFAEGEGHYPQTQNYLRSAVAKCMLCHTQTANGPELKLDQFKAQFAALSADDRFTALTATRQFDEALTLFATMVEESKTGKGTPNGAANSAAQAAMFDRNARVAMAVLVRVKKDPARALSLIDKMTASEVGTTVLRNDLKGWKRDLLTWQSEKAKGGEKEMGSDQALFNEASRLKKSALQAEAPLVNATSSSIAYLRASALLHDLLLQYPKSHLRPQSYLMLASIYESLPGFSIWDLSDEYLGACIQENPHSEMGEKCFQQYNESLIGGYTGSSGTHIPAAVQRHLSKMHDLANRIVEPTKIN